MNSKIHLVCNPECCFQTQITKPLLSWNKSLTLNNICLPPGQSHTLCCIFQEQACLQLQCILVNCKMLVGEGEMLTKSLQLRCPHKCPLSNPHFAFKNISQELAYNFALWSGEKQGIFSGTPNLNKAVISNVSFCLWKYIV